VGVKEEAPKALWRRGIRWFVTFHLVCLSWVFFRSSGISAAWNVVRRIATWSPGDYPYGVVPAIVLIGVLVADVADLRNRWVEWINRRRASLRWLVYAAVLLLFLTFQRASNPEFIYFQF